MRKPTLAIAMPVLNEEKNIMSLLEALIKQDIQTVTLKSIKVYSDGSTDRTNEYVKKMITNKNHLSLVEGKVRKGKVARLNEIFKDTNTDFLIVLDGDIELVTQNFIDNLLKRFIKNEKMLMVAAHQIAKKPNTFVGKIIQASFANWDSVRLGIKDYRSVHNFYGAATAYRKTFFKNLSIPKSFSEERIYIYLMANMGKSFLYEPSAEICYWTPQTLKDFLKLSEREFGKQDKKVEEMFDISVEELSYVPMVTRIKGFLKAILKNPFYSILALGLNFYLRRSHEEKNSKKLFWETTESSKGVIVSYE